MRILHCIHHLQGGGAERQVQLLANASEAFGMQAGVFCVQDQGREAFASSVSLFVGRRRHKVDFGLFGEVKRAIRRFNADVAHIWLPEAVTIPALAVAGSLGIPAVFSYRWAMHWHRALAVVEFALAAAFSTTIISNHAVTQDSWPYRWLFRQKQGTVIPNGVATIPVAAGAYPERQRRDPPIVLYAGRLTRMKNWECLLQAIALLRSKRPCRLVMCGQGEDRGLIEARADMLGIRDQVEMRGFQNPLHPVMATADVFVLPSWSEGMSNVLFEALACQLPCIISDIPSHRELTASRECARLFNPHSPEDLACALEELLESPALRERYRAAGLSVLGEFNVETMVRRHVGVYRRILSLRSTPSRQRVAF